jgi:hypothetical protein
MLYSINNVIKDKLLIKPCVRSFSSSPLRKADPLSTTAMAISIPYAVGFVSNPFSLSLVLLTGMATAIFGLTASFITFAETNELGLILQYLDNIFSLYETYISISQSGIDILRNALNNFAPEVLVYFYDPLQEVLTLTECLFAELNTLMTSPYVMYAGEPVVDRGESILENLRLVGNDLIGLIRDIENRLNIPEDSRVPTF